MYWSSDEDELENKIKVKVCACLNFCVLCVCMGVCVCVCVYWSYDEETEMRICEVWVFFLCCMRVRELLCMWLGNRSAVIVSMYECTYAIMYVSIHHITSFCVVCVCVSYCHSHNM